MRKQSLLTICAVAAFLSPALVVPSAHAGQFAGDTALQSYEPAYVQEQLSVYNSMEHGWGAGKICSALTVTHALYVAVGQIAEYKDTLTGLRNWVRSAANGEHALIRLFGPGANFKKIGPLQLRVITARDGTKRLQAVLGNGPKKVVVSDGAPLQTAKNILSLATDYLGLAWDAAQKFASDLTEATPPCAAEKILTTATEQLSMYLALQRHLGGHIYEQSIWYDEGMNVLDEHVCRRVDLWMWRPVLYQSPIYGYGPYKAVDFTVDLTYTSLPGSSEINCPHGEQGQPAKYPPGTPYNERSVAPHAPRASYAASVLADNPLGYWPLNEPQPGGPGTFHDASGHGADAENPGGVLVNSPPIVRGGGHSAFFLEAWPEQEGIDVGVPADVVPELTVSSTLEAWVVRAVPASGEIQVMRINNASLFIDSGGYVHCYFAGADIEDNAGSEAQGTLPIKAGLPSSLIDCRYNIDTGETQIFIDGRMESRSTRTMPAGMALMPPQEGSTAPVSLFIGGPYSSTDFYLGDVAVYGSALSETRIAAHWAAGRGAKF